MKKVLSLSIISYFGKLSITLCSLRRVLYIALFLVPCSIQAQVPSYVPTSGLVGWWPFNGNANDESGNGNNGTVNGATLTTDRFGVANKAYSFDGVNDFINVLNPSVLNFSSGVDFTVSFFYNPGSVTSNPSGFNGLVSRMRIDNAGPMNGWQIGRNNSIYKIEVQSSGCGSNLNSIVQNNWIHVLTVFDRTLGQIRYYLDGVLINTTPCISLSDSFISSHDLKFGVERSGVYYSSGVLDDIAIYNRALTQQEITNLYTSSAPPSITTSASPSLINCGESATLTASSTVPIQSCFSNDLPVSLQNGLVGYWPFCGNTLDGSSNGNNGTINGSLYSIDRFGSQSASLEITDGLQIMCTNNLMNNPNQFSMSLWFNSSNTTSTSPEGLGRIFGFDNGQCQHIFNQDRYIDIMTNGKIRFHINHTSGNYFIYSNPGKNDGNWHNVVCTFGADGMKLYVDGNMEDSNPNSSISSYNGYWRIGGLNDSYSPSFIGKVDDVALYNRVLTPTEIQQLYTLVNVNYSWSTGATTPSITVSPAQTTSYSCTATNSAGSTTSSVTVTVADSLSWTGLFDTDWHKPCNWSPQFVPKCCNIVVIPVTSNQPIVSGVAAAEDLTIFATNGAQLTVNNGANLQIADCPTTITTTACPSLPLLTTTIVTNNSQLIPLSGGTISYEGSSSILARGVCWSLSTNPTVANSFSSDSVGIGTFSSNITGLIAGSTYFVRAYATNSSGTSYGDEVSFVYSPNFVIGDNYGGGIVAYLFQAGDQGYVAGQQHGIICSATDQSSGIQWYNGSYCCKTWANDDAIGFGQINTNKILNVQGIGTYAASITDNLVLNGYSDWFLPSINELQWVYNNRAIIGGFSGIYWSSSEFSAGWNYVKVVSFDQGWTGSRAKAIACKVRAIRYF